MSKNQTAISVENAITIAAHLKAILDNEQAPASLVQDVREAVTNLFNNNGTDTNAISDAFFNIRNTLLAHGQNGKAINELETKESTRTILMADVYSDYKDETELLHTILFQGYAHQADQQYSIAKNLLRFIALLETNPNIPAALEQISTWIYYWTEEFTTALDKAKEGKAEAA